MSYSNRPAHRPDPSTGPNWINPATGKLEVRPPFTATPHMEHKARESKLGKRRARRRARLDQKYGRNSSYTML